MSSVVLLIQDAKLLGHTLISDLVVTNLFMHSLPGMILLYLTASFYTKGVLAWDIITFVRFMHCYSSRIIDSHTATPAEANQKIHQSLAGTILDFLLSSFQNNCNIRANSGIYERRSSLVVDLWSTGSGTVSQKL